MSKIIGVTVGTPMGPKSIQEKLKPVRSINGVTPDADGNVEITQGAASWNDLTDKPFGEEYDYEQFLTINARYDYTVVENAAIPFAVTARVQPPFSTTVGFEFGETYRFTVGDYVFEGLCTTNGSIAGIGNIFLFYVRNNQDKSYEDLITAGYKDTGEDFFMWFNGEVIISRREFIDNIPSTKEIICEKRSTVITKIDPKYLPEVDPGQSVSDDEMVQLLMDMDLVQPVSDGNNAVYVDENNKLYVL